MRQNGTAHPSAQDWGSGRDHDFRRALKLQKLNTKKTNNPVQNGKINWTENSGFFLLKFIFTFYFFPLVDIFIF
jgi:hypothetical protein